MRLKSITAALIPIFAVLLADQVTKIWVKTHMALHESIRVTDWFYILFTENRGMAFGMELVDKYLLTGFRVVAVVWLSWYLYRLLRRGENIGYVICISLITAGAIGNIIDCVFYGVIFNAPDPPYVAHFTEWGYGYDVLLRGRVVDMLYFPLVSWHWPEWFPFWAGQKFVFFSPVFNIADSAITCGVMALIAFYHERFQR